jgi:ribosomal protein S16
MAVRIRLKRIGKNVKGRAYYRVVVLDENRSRDGKSIVSSVPTILSRRLQR